MIYIISFIALMLLIVIHEFGHFLAAKANGVAVEKFSIGFGKKLFSFQWLGTEFLISAIPLGGYVKMKAENPDEESAGAEDEFLQKKWYQKISIAFAGPLANFFLAVVLMFFAFFIGQIYQDQEAIVGKVNSDRILLQKNDEILSINNVAIISWSDIYSAIEWNEKNTFEIRRNGTTQTVSFSINKEDIANNLYPKSETIIGDVISGLPAYRAGLKEGDKIVEVNDTKVDDWYEMRAMITKSEAEQVAVKFLRENQNMTAILDLQEDVIGGNKMIGVMQKMPIKIKDKKSFSESLVLSGKSAVAMVAGTYYGLYKLIRNPKEIKANIGSPVMLFSMTQKSAQKGIASVITLFASISIMLMVMNLLPIPVLDGGQIVFYAMEGIIGKPIPMKFQIIAQQLGFLLLMILMVTSFYNDFDKLAQRQKSLKNAELIEEN